MSRRGVFFAALCLAGCVSILILREWTHVRPASLEGIIFFPQDNVWNASVEELPVDKNSSAYVNSIGANRPLHPDFGSGIYKGRYIGIPYNVVTGCQKKLNVEFSTSDESDPGPYPIPDNAIVEGDPGPIADNDRHLVILDKDNLMLYELYQPIKNEHGAWKAESGAIFDLKSNLLRPNGWTSTDAAGLPVLPGLIRFDEVQSGEIKHAIRFTVAKTRRAYVWPARHYASRLTENYYPPMGQRFRLKRDVDISPYTPEVQVILKALKRYGMILADNGGSMFMQGVPDGRWSNKALSALKNITAGDFEAVDCSTLMIDADSGRVK